MLISSQQKLSSPQFLHAVLSVACNNGGVLSHWLREKSIQKRMKAGDRIRVKESVLVYHHPEHRNQAFDLKGQEGEVIGVVNEWQGKPISANFPILVKFTPKFKAHLREGELEVIE